jgi:hypothetical protein
VLQQGCNGAGMKTMERRETFTRYYCEDPTLLWCCIWNQNSPHLLGIHLSDERSLCLIRRGDQRMRWGLSTILICFKSLHQMAIVSLQQPTQQHTLSIYHCYHSLGCWWSLSGAVLWKVLQQGWNGDNEDNGEAGNFYSTILLYCVGETVEGQIIL